jgi:hypothetical protein
MENKEFYKAFLVAQKSIQGAHKDSQNPHFKSKYADLESVMDAVKVPLNSAGIIIVQPIVGDKVLTALIHAETGERIESEMPIVCKDPSDPQKWGSAITYARRYTLASLCALPAVDDDGNEAAKAPKVQPPKAPAPDKDAAFLAAIFGIELHPDQLTTLLDEFKARNLQSLPADQRQEFYKQAKALKEANK